MTPCGCDVCISLRASDDKPPLPSTDHAYLHVKLELLEGGLNGGQWMAEVLACEPGKPDRWGYGYGADRPDAISRAFYDAYSDIYGGDED